ncbi:DUF3459 domain-containing protein [bacterium]|nr:DUF3459 domain-containing protein [bacterium]
MRGGKAVQAAALLFSLDGIPLLVNGQQIGTSTHPCMTTSIFQWNLSIRSLDRNGLFPYYQKLIALKKELPALRSGRREEIPIHGRKAAFAFRRWEAGLNVFSVMNMSETPVPVDLTLPLEACGLDSGRLYYLTDMLGGGL